MPNSAGDAFIEVHPDLQGFGPTLGKGIDPHIDKAASGITSKLGGAFRSVAGIAAGLGAGLAVGSFFKGAFGEAEEARKTLAQTNAVLKSTGGEAGVTAEGVSKLADKLSALTGIDDEAIASTENLLLTFTNIKNAAGKGNDIFDQTTLAVQDMSVALGQDAKSSAIQLGKALNDPIKGISALSRVGVSFTEQQKDQIKALVESGRTLEAQKIILGEINKEFGGSAAAAASPMARLKVAFGNLQEQVGTALLPTLSRVATFLADKLPGAIEAGGRAFSAIGRFVGPFLKELVKDVTQGFGGFKSALSGEGMTSDGFVGVMERIGVAARGVVEWIKTNWPQIQATIAGVIDWIRSDVLPKVQEVAAFIISQYATVIEWVKTNWPAISEAIGHVIAVVKDIFDKLGPTVRVVFELIKTNIETQLHVILTIIRAVLDIINGDWRKVWGGIKDFFAGIWDKIFEVVRNGVARIVDAFLGMVGHIIHAADSAFGWIPGIGDKLHDARVAFDNFRDDVNESLRGIQDRDVIVRLKYLEEHGVSKENDTNTGTAGDPSTLDQYALGFAAGPVRGPLGEPRLVVAHGGEWIGTPEDWEAVASGRSGGSADPSSGAGHGHAIYLDGMKVGEAVAPGVSRAQYKGRLR